MKLKKETQIKLNKLLKEYADNRYKKNLYLVKLKELKAEINMIMKEAKVDTYKNNDISISKTSVSKHAIDPVLVKKEMGTNIIKVMKENSYTKLDILVEKKE